MTKVTYQPWKEIIIHEADQFPIETFLAILVLGVPPGGLAPRLLWAHGVAFTTADMPYTEATIKESLQGRVHWSSVEWTLMPEYSPFIEIPETKVRIPVIDVSSSEILSEAAKWLKNRSK